MMKLIHTRAELVELAKELGVRKDWHEPDEQDVTAELRGTPTYFDNAMGVGEWFGHAYGEPKAELYVVLRRYNSTMDGPGEEIAAVNLATLFAWATGHEAPPPAKQSNLDLAAKVQRFGDRVASAAREQPGLPGEVVADITQRVTGEIVKMIKNDE